MGEHHKEACPEIKQRVDVLAEWMLTHGSFAMQERHLNANSTERLYWHYGYLMALQDMLSMEQGGIEQVDPPITEKERAS